jgi:hypothetical protein
MTTSICPEWPTNYFSHFLLTEGLDDMNKVYHFFPHCGSALPVPFLQNDGYSYTSNKFIEKLAQWHFDCIIIPQTLEEINPEDSAQMINLIIKKQGTPHLSLLAIRAIDDPSAIESFEYVELKGDFISNLNETISNLGKRENLATLLVTYNSFEVDWEKGLTFLLSDEQIVIPY